MPSKTDGPWPAGAGLVRRSTGLTIVLASALAVGCRGQAAPSRGREQPRVVSLHDVTTEIVVALGAVDRLVGVADPVEVPAEVMAALKGVPRVSGVESVSGVRASVVLGTDVIAERSPDLVAFLEQRAVDVWLASPARLEDVFAAVGEVAARLGLPGRGQELVTRLRARVDAVGAAERASPVPVFVYDCCDPAFTAAGKTVLTDLIARAGGRNIFADLDADWTKVSWEEVIARRPRLVLIHDYAYGGQGDVEAKRQQLRAIRSLAGLPTAVFPLGLSLGGIRSVDALERLHRILASAGGAG